MAQQEQTKLRRTVAVFNAGFQIGNRHYAAPELQPWTGREVDVFYDPEDGNKVRVRDGVGGHICWAHFKGIADDDLALHLGAMVEDLNKGGVK